MNKRVEIAALLIDIEAQIRSQGWWESAPPSPEAMSSQMPFCVDTLSFPQWLQFVLLPRLHHLIVESAELPDRCGIAAMAEVWFEGSGHSGAELIKLLQSLDQLLDLGAA